MNTSYEALARTTLLLNREFFSGDADERTIADALLATTVRMAADEANVTSRAGQTALVTGFLLTARLGIGIELDAPNVPVIDRAAPLREPLLVDALVEIGSDLVPGARVRTTAGDVDESFVFGRAASEGEGSGVHVAATDFTAELARDARGSVSEGDLPLGGFAAGAAIAAVALEAAMQRIEKATGLRVRRPRPSAGPPAMIDLRDLFPEIEKGLVGDIGKVSVISGGAITHALVFCLLRIPGLRAELRIIEEQTADLSNVNRYALLRVSDDGRAKVEQLEGAASPDLRITGIPMLFTKETRDKLVPLAVRVVVGVDEVEARWWVQEENPVWLAVGATGNHLAQLTIHGPDGPCAGCAHPTPLEPQTIPTISFVSFWAGLLQACALISRASSTGRNVVVYPFAFGGRAPVATFALVPNTGCPIGCPASKRPDQGKGDS
ncbi:MAG: ThiF family adenylyltransferase [Actinobacteria bacterium]|nr:ThiF family adenylyltransferase [Actinomycetota bacterium]